MVRGHQKEIRAWGRNEVAIIILCSFLGSEPASLCCTLCSCLHQRKPGLDSGGRGAQGGRQDPGPRSGVGCWEDVDLGLLTELAQGGVVSREQPLVLCRLVLMACMKLASPRSV